MIPTFSLLTGNCRDSVSSMQSSSSSSLSSQEGTLHPGTPGPDKRTNRSQAFRLAREIKDVPQENSFGAIGQPINSITQLQHLFAPLDPSQFGQGPYLKPWAMPNPAIDDAPSVFFKTLMTSVKEANRCNSIKSSSWKNPMLYKTTLCDHWRFRGACRFGSSCWYAHGEHDLRFVPRTSQLPTPDYIHNYLSYLGLPKSTLDGMISQAYQAAGLGPDGIPNGCSMELKSSSPTTEQDFSRDDPIPDCPSSVGNTKHNAFDSSEATDWDFLRNMIDSTAIQPDFHRSFRLFDDNYPLRGDNAA